MVRLNASEPLPDHGLAAPANAFDQSLGDDDQSSVGHGTAADLAVLDYMSDRVLDEVSSADLLIKSSSVTSLPGAGHSDPQSSDIANVAMRRLDCLAREHALFRQNHFTRGLFLDSNHRPSDELSTERWCMSLARINFATFALLIFRPQAVVVEAVAQSMPNHGRVVASLGLKAATRAFFEHIVPVNKRNADTLRLLVDMQTQMWLLAADDEASLQETIAIERGTSTDSIKTLLAIDPDSGFGDDGIQRFDTRGVTMYQSEVNRRLSKISGGKLNITRLQYPLDNLWMSLSKYCIAEVADKPPCVIRQALSEKEPEDSDLDLADDDIGDDLRIDEPAYADTLSGSQQMPVDGDFEITILKEPKGKDAAVPTASATVINQVHDVDIPIDPSFSEERRVALLLKDALSDNHLDALLSKIEAEPIDTLQTRMRTRMSERIRPVRMEQAPEMANNSADDDDDDGFRLQIDESDDGWDVGGSGDRDANEPTRHAPSPVHTRSQGKRRRVYSEREDYSVESSDEERIINGKVPRTKPQRAKSYRDLSESEEAASVQQILDVITGTPRSKGMRYSPLKLSTSVNGGFQGRRGIAAEDISDLARSHSPVRFTQSSDEYSGPDDANGDESEAEGARRLVPTTSAGEEDAAERLGQYRPIQRAQEESDNEYDEYDDGAGASNHKLKARRVSRKTKKQTQHRTRWTRAEEECFVRAMHEYGNGWTAILSEHGVNGTVDRVLAKRNRENLKDKARNIKIRLMREGKPLGPFSNACGHL
ncbi:hypothetical protein LPJ59_004743 [Coemansia sp. RSA 2399]|nr:hypothetical protein LPJ59_004743 [Coemansia sp. RSA 2399]KAJ1897518.1 hypothetical protein LPJ81_004524 [Coemansia sp. IMI 209127]